MKGSRPIFYARRHGVFRAFTARCRGAGTCRLVPAAVRMIERNDFMKEQIRLLRPEEIECRVSSASERGVMLLLYKDARADQKILDEAFGIFGWKRSHQCIDGNLYCTVEVFDQKKGCWVSKQDVGTSGDYEKEKSQASDSFKRACVNWGIGRELYSAPFIWVSSRDAEIRKKDGKYYCSDHFSVSSIGYSDDREIASLSISNDSQNGKCVYELRRGKGQETPAETGMQDGKEMNRINDSQMHSLESELRRTGVGIDAVRERYGIKEPRNMPEEMYDRVMRALARTKSSGSAA